MKCLIEKLIAFMRQIVYLFHRKPASTKNGEYLYKIFYDTLITVTRFRTAFKERASH